MATRSLMDKWMPLDDAKYPSNPSITTTTSREGSVARPHRLGVGAKPAANAKSNPSNSLDDKATLKIKRQIAKQKAADMSNAVKRLKASEQEVAQDSNNAGTGISASSNKRPKKNANDILSQYLDRPKKRTKK